MKLNKFKLVYSSRQIIKPFQSCKIPNKTWNFHMKNVKIL